MSYFSASDKLTYPKRLYSLICREIRNGHNMPVEMNLGASWEELEMSSSPHPTGKFVAIYELKVVKKWEDLLEEEDQQKLYSL